MKSKEVKLSLENLEGRIVPTTFTFGGFGVILAIDCTMDRNGVNYKAADIVVTDTLAVNKTTGQSCVIPSKINGVSVVGVFVKGTPTHDKIDVSQFTRGTAQIWGYDGNDVIWGTNLNSKSQFADIIYGGYGDDTIYGLDGNDIIYGDAGNDKLFGGAGFDGIKGGLGNDYLNAGEVNSQNYNVNPFSYKIEGTVGSKAMLVYGDNSYYFRLGNYYGDALFGDEGDDVLFARANTALNPLHGALLMGGAGFDTFDGTTDPNDLQTENIVVAVDYSWHYTSNKWNKVTKKYDYSGVTYENLAPRTYFLNSYTKNPLTWYYGRSA